MKQMLIFLLLAGLLLMGTCAIATEEQEGIDEIDIDFCEPTDGDPTPCGGGGGAGEGGAPG